MDVPPRRVGGQENGVRPPATPAACFGLISPALPGTKGPWKAELDPSASSAIEASTAFLPECLICW